MTENEAIGARIRSRRKELDLTLQEVADKVGVQNSTIYRYEIGAINKIKLPVIEAIASALHVNPDWLILKTDDPTDYDDGDLLAEIPLAYMEACDGDTQRARAMMLAVEQDHQQELNSTLTHTELHANDPDLYLIARARKEMPDKEKKRMMNILKLSFEDYFSGDYVDDDVDE